jgi:hypothetical protein
MFSICGLNFWQETHDSRANIDIKLLLHYIYVLHELVKLEYWIETSEFMILNSYLLIVLEVKIKDTDYGLWPGQGHFTWNLESHVSFPLCWITQSVKFKNSLAYTEGYNDAVVVFGWKTSFYRIYL